MRHIELELRGEHIALDALLKATGLAASGGAAKADIAAGRVQVDGQVELRRGRKVRAGQVVAVHGTRVRVQAPDAGRRAPPRRDADGAGTGTAANGSAADNASADSAPAAPDGPARDATPG